LVVDGTHLYLSGGTVSGGPALVEVFESDGQLMAKQVWQSKSGGHSVASPVLVGERLFTIDSDGTIVILSAQDGQQVFELLLDHSVYSSPIGTNTCVYVWDTGVELIRSFELGEAVVATPAVVSNCMIVRTDNAIYRLDGDRHQL
jgi:outer membrane protein assembly factor BamB